MPFSRPSSTVSGAGLRQDKAWADHELIDNVHIAPDLVATGAIGPETPYFMPCSTAPYLPRSFTQCFVCTSLCHRLLQSGAALQSDQLVLARRLQRHRGDALRALTADLASPEHQTSDLTLASVIVLLLVEVSVVLICNRTVYDF